MNKMQSEIDVDKVIKTLNDTFQDIRDNFDPEKLSEEERDEIAMKFDELEKLALKARAMFD